MNKTVKLYLVILLILFIGVAAVELSLPKPINWTQTYNEKHKIPYGTYILHDQLKYLFPNDSIITIRTTPYQYFNALYNWQDSTYTSAGTYLLIKGFTNMDDASSQELLDFASHGNEVFIASNYPPQNILDSLHITVKYDYNFKGRAELSLSNPVFKKDSITIEKGLSNSYFSALDTVNTTVLGYQKFNTSKHINYVKVSYGSGHVLVHLQPAVFTNYHLLKEDHRKYAAAILSYIKEGNIYFDSQNKLGNSLGNSPLRFILNEPALRWSWYLGLISLALFMVFNAKRKQRIIQVIKPLENTTIAFTKTIGNLYYETRDHHTIIDKKITYFLEHVRRLYYIDTQVLDDTFIKTLSLKSGKDRAKLNQLITLIINLKGNRQCTEDDLLKLNTAIENFYTT
ncbi:DUF4350 domain-containing protein [Aestuariivivens sediminis]|uniref:DUF4350 domain-containing protein n=1 Tax=Aestuariivivens sediminis TaxID=2913557 RepID=UPI001F563F76|nr:DUF4350 domain-containing protein [Aestuariivivens sediminis]